MSINASSKKIEANVGDMITIVSPWEESVNYVGLVTEVSDGYIHVYHCEMDKQIVWSRFVNCIVDKV
jgi:hypothetical protein